MKKFTRYTTMLVCLLAFCSGFVQVKAATYQSYNYNVFGESVPTPLVYETSSIYHADAEDQTAAFKTPSDLFVYDGQLYILDNGNSRIVVLDSQYRLVKEIKITDGENAPLDISKAEGLYIDAEVMLLSMGEDKKVLLLDHNGRLVREITTPVGKDSKEINFVPMNAIRGSDNTLYVVSKGSFEGIVQLTAEGEYIGYYGANRVDVTAKVLAEYFWKKLLSEEQKDKVEKVLPIEYSNLAIDSKGFVYAVSPVSENSMNEIKKLNPKGDNVLRVKDAASLSPGVRMQTGNYGDIELSYDQGVTVDSSFCDVCVDENGFINALDKTRGRVFQYDADSNLIAVFGGIGEQKGTFAEPIAVEVFHDEILVLDQKHGEITAFAKTDFGTAVHQAVVLYNQGEYGKSEELWNQVLATTSNYDMAYLGMGKSKYSKGEYEEAMKYFELGYAKQEYDQAFTEYRKNFLKANMAPLLIGAILLIVALWVGIRFYRKKRYLAVWLGKNNSYLPVSYSCFHPFKAFDEIKVEKKGTYRASILIVLAFLLSTVIAKGSTGFLFNNQRIEQINIVQDIFLILLLLVTFIICNGAVATLIDGEGKWKEITVVTCYSLMPVVVANIIKTVVSNFITLREGNLLLIISQFCVILAGCMLFVGIMTIHRYSASKTIGSLLLTAFGMLVVMFIGVMVYTLLGQLITFISNVITEIAYGI